MVKCKLRYPLALLKQLTAAVLLVFGFMAFTIIAGILLIFTIFALAAGGAAGALAESGGGGDSRTCSRCGMVLSQGVGCNCGYE